MALVVVLPIVLRELTAAEFAVWSVFSLVVSLQGVAELGFGVTFVRVIAYAMGGCHTLAAPGGTGAKALDGPNWPLLARILATMRTIYDRLCRTLGVLLIIAGTVSLWLPVHRTDQPQTAWIAWSLVAAVTLATFYCNQYSNFLQGTNHIALLRRWETLFALANTVSSFLVLWLGGGLLGLIVASQLWTALGAVRNFWLARHVLEGRFRDYPAKGWDQHVYDTVWPSAWRSGIGSAMSFGLIQISGLFHAQSRDLTSVNSYLLGLRLLQAISQFSQAPFYSKLPTLARLYAEEKRDSMVALAKRGMTMSYWSYVLPVVAVGFAGPWLLAKIGSSAPFPADKLWLVLGAAIFVERYGAMHLQMYSTTNKIIWHIANGVTGTVMVGLWLVLYPRFGAMGLASGMLIAYLFFYAWFCAWRAHRAFGLTFPTYDLATGGGPLFFYLLFAGFAVMYLRR